MVHFLLRGSEIFEQKLDGISMLTGSHECAQLTYDSAAITLGSLHTSAWVFVLLGAFYATLGPCFVALDSLTLRQGC